MGGGGDCPPAPKYGPDVILNIKLAVGHEDRLQVITVATSETDGYERFMRSVRLFDIDVEVSTTIVFICLLYCLKL